MIKNQEVARQLIAVLDDCSDRINETIRLVQGKCPEDEFRTYRQAAGFVMGYIYTEVVAPLYKEHPELEPSELRSGPD